MGIFRIDPNGNIVYCWTYLDMLLDFLTGLGLKIFMKLSYDRVKEMVERQKEKYGWEFLFLGANIDAIATAGRFGIYADRASNYNSDHEGTALHYEVVSDAVKAMRCCSAPIDGGWKKRIEEDYEKRGKKGSK